MDLGGRHSGAVSGAMNTCGNLGSFVSANAFPFLQGLTGDASAYFCAAALLNAAAIFCWLQMKPPGRESLIA